MRVTIIGRQPGSIQIQPAPGERWPDDWESPCGFGSMLAALLYCANARYTVECEPRLAPDGESVIHESWCDYQMTFDRLSNEQLERHIFLMKLKLNFSCRLWEINQHAYLLLNSRIAAKKELHRRINK